MKRSSISAPGLRSGLGHVFKWKPSPETVRFNALWTRFLALHHRDKMSFTSDFYVVEYDYNGEFMVCQRAGTYDAKIDETLKFDRIVKFADRSSFFESAEEAQAAITRMDIVGQLAAEFEKGRLRGLEDGRQKGHEEGYKVAQGEFHYVHGKSPTWTSMGPPPPLGGVAPNSPEHQNQIRQWMKTTAVQPSCQPIPPNNSKAVYDANVKAADAGVKQANLRYLGSCWYDGLGNVWNRDKRCWEPSNGA
jgi:hypothetical protein